MWWTKIIRLIQFFSRLVNLGDVNSKKEHIKVKICFYVLLKSITQNKSKTDLLLLKKSVLVWWKLPYKKLNKVLGDEDTLFEL